MIKANKDKLTVDGELEVVMAEFMCIAAYMIETFGIESTMSMVGIALKETGGAEDDEEPPLRNCDTCDNNGWSMPQCRECDISNAYKWYVPRKRKESKE